MPKLWSATIQEHRSAVLDAILDATGHLVHRHGMTSLTMTALAEEAGVGRATLYKYVPDTAAAIAAWQQREMGRHLSRLREIAAQSPTEVRLENMLEAYARLRYHRHGAGAGEDLHSPIRLAPAESELRELFAAVIATEVEARRARADVPPDQLAAYVVAAIGAVGNVPDMVAARRIVALVTNTVRDTSTAARAV
ncbi:TetR/AcrR family transcriptional regulator [Agromyces sp. Leaf222]|jgi:AcrR family transcriptional regulator|uniref:TetR/AcrR family transcriptional regulator n=1 Tax=Agromyces sp. Leaf222 TaxID=1735688 RepID=UPI0006FFFBD0|nr:TetR/AcrR family transcriptional regulator [Agromyces sp. Leaf222]KQM82388.1 hypothetical protein ASE68_03070 [Agromyces sp. Leaf222]